MSNNLDTVLENVKEVLPKANVRKHQGQVKANLSMIENDEFEEMYKLKYRWGYNFQIMRSGAGLLIIVTS